MLTMRDEATETFRRAALDGVMVFAQQVKVRPHEGARNAGGLDPIDLIRAQKKRRPPT